MRDILVHVFMLGVAVGFTIYGYLQFQLFKHKKSLPTGSGGGGKNRPAKKNP